MTSSRLPLVLLLVAGCGDDPVTPISLYDTRDMMVFPASCMDGIQDDGETDLDCGGGGCAPCGDGMSCTDGTDCASGLCTGLRCDPPSCSDGVKNGFESDVDCGPGCRGCAIGERCGYGSDCVSRACANNVCVTAQCTDGVKNGDESDVDCGGFGGFGLGGMCPPCGAGRECHDGSHCRSGRCFDHVCRGDIACMMGTADCDEDAGNGCEADLETDRGHCGSCGNRCLDGLRCAGGVCLLVSPPVQYDGVFVRGQAANQACADWMAFRGKLRGDYTRVTIQGSSDPGGVSCTRPLEARFICNALLKAAPSSTPCDNRIWSVSRCGLDVELAVDSVNCRCDAAGYTVRPCNGVQWGGVNSNTCDCVSQTITVICE